MLFTSGKAISWFCIHAVYCYPPSSMTKTENFTAMQITVPDRTLPLGLAAIANGSINSHFYTHSYSSLQISFKRLLDHNFSSPSPTAIRLCKEKHFAYCLNAIKCFIHHTRHQIPNPSLLPKAKLQQESPKQPYHYYTLEGCVCHGVKGMAYFNSFFLKFPFIRETPFIR